MGYQWTRNSIWIPGATGPSYTLPAAQATDSGAQFACRVSTAVTVQTRSALLIVSPPGPVPVLAAPPMLQVEPATDAPGMLLFRFPTEPGFLYRLQARPGADGEEWLNLSAEGMGDGGVQEILIPVVGVPSGHFRLLVVAGPVINVP